MKTYKQLTMREAYDLFVAGADVERYWAGIDGGEFDVGTLKDRYSGGGPGTWEGFQYTYSNSPPLFRVEVE